MIRRRFATLVMQISPIIVLINPAADLFITVAGAKCFADDDGGNSS